MKKQIHLKIYGHVQGVFFRAEAQKMAESLGLVGQVKNMEDGTVEITAEGEEENLKKLAAWAKRGPELAKVEKIETVWLDSSGNFSDFQIQ